MNVLEPIQRVAAAMPRMPALITDDWNLNYAQLWRLFGRIAWHLVREGVEPGQCIVVGNMSLEANIMVRMAAAYVGASAVGAPVDLPAPTLEHFFRTTSPVLWVTSEAPRLQTLEIRVVTPNVLFEELPADAQPPELLTGLAQAAWKIVTTSGTTGDKKLVPATHGQFAAMQRASLDAYPTGPGERFYVLMGMVGISFGHIFRHFAAGATVLMSRQARGEVIAERIARDAPNRILSSPANMEALVDYLVRSDLKASGRSLSEILIGGGVVRPKLRQQIAMRLCPNIVVVYGSTEAGTLAKLDVSTYLESPRSAGRLVPSVEAQCVDDDDRPLPHGQVGRLRLRSPGMADQYLGEPQATAEAFRGGWFYPGDRASIDDKRVLTLAGRADDLLNIGGVKFDPLLVEAALNSHPGFADSAATLVSMPDGREVIALLVIRAQEAPLPEPQEIRDYIAREYVDLYRTPVVVPVNALPRNPAGKLDRNRVRQIAAAAAAKADAP